MANYVIQIKYSKVIVTVSDEVYDVDEQNKIKRIVSTFSKDIVIDRTYVSTKNTKYDKTFLTEYGWNKLCKLIQCTELGKKTTKKQQIQLQSSCYALVLGYLYSCLADYGYTDDGIFLDIQNKSLYMLTIEEDTYQEYRRYPGKWQNWNKDN